MTPLEHLIRSKTRARDEAQQDREIKAAVEWLKVQEPVLIAGFWLRLNNASEDLRLIPTMADAELHVLRSLAMIGLTEVFKSYMSGQSDQNG